jgi:hypothetical protein
MASVVQNIKLSPSRDIPFSKLVLSQSKFRRVKAGVAIERLAESIAQRTLLQCLSVRAVVDTPVDAASPAILATVLECYPIARIADRATA